MSHLLVFRELAYSVIINFQELHSKKEQFSPENAESVELEFYLMDKVRSAFLILLRR
jgi:hypothetical protein